MEAEAVFTVQQVVAAAFMLYLCMFLSPCSLFTCCSVDLLRDPRGEV